MLLMLQAFLVKAQYPGATQVADLPVIGISRSVSLHFISPEPIQYVDLSSHAIKGDLPVKNLLRLQILADSLEKIANSRDGGTVTIVGEKFIAQYRLCYLPPEKTEFISSQIDIQPEYMKPLDISAVGLSTNERKANALAMLKDRSAACIRQSDDYGIEIRLNRIYTVGDEVFLDISFNNRTNIPYDVDELRFKIEDKKINKATNVQSTEIHPLFQLYPFERFKSRYRNIYVLKKATFPENKVLNISLTEKQLSGRNLSLIIKYKDILGADAI